MFWLRIGQELTQLKNTMQFTYSERWPKDQKARGWAEYLRIRFQSDKDPDKSISNNTAIGWMQWAVLHHAFQAENEARAQRNQLPLPLPSSISQLRPYQSMMRRVDDYQYPPGCQAGNQTSFEMDPPYAEDQSEVIAAWEAAWETIPPDKRIRNGESVPPTESVSRQYLREREGLRQLKAREERELDDAKQTALTVNQKPVSPKPSQTTDSPKARRQPAPPKKSAAEIEAERRAYQLQQDARQYRLKLSNLQQSAESLRAFLKGTLAREGSEAYLTELRVQELGIYSVGDDVKLLREAVVVLQEVFQLATSPYTPPAPMPKGAGTAADEVVDVAVN